MQELRFGDPEKCRVELLIENKIIYEIVEGHSFQGRFLGNVPTSLSTLQGEEPAPTFSWGGGI